MLTTATPGPQPPEPYLNQMSVSVLDYYQMYVRLLSTASGEQADEKRGVRLLVRGRVRLFMAFLRRGGARDDRTGRPDAGSTGCLRLRLPAGVTRRPRTGDRHAQGRGRAGSADKGRAR